MKVPVTRRGRRAIAGVPALLCAAVLVAPAFSAPTMSVVASGLDAPKQVTAGPDGNLYVTCSGHAGPTDPVVGGKNSNQTGSVQRISPSGVVSPVLTSLRSQFYEGSSVGPSGIAFWNGHLYVAQSLQDPLNSPAGQLISSPVLKVLPSGQARVFTSFNALPNNVTDPSSALDTNPYGATVGGDGALYVSDGGDNGIWRVQENGDASMFIQFPGNPVVTGITATPSQARGHWPSPRRLPFPWWAQGRQNASNGIVAALFGNGASGFSNGRVVKVDSHGTEVLVPEGRITMPIGVAYSPSGKLYVLQFSATNPNPGPPFVAGTGAIWSVSNSGQATKVLSGLTFPTGITFTNDGTAYVTNNGLMPATGEVTGQLVKVTGLE